MTTVYTAHLRAHTPPVLVHEGFAWGALVFGPLWLFAHRVWIAGILVLVADGLIAALPSAALRLALAVALAWLLGLFGQDLRRWSLARRGFVFAHVVAADGPDAALSRLLTRRPDLVVQATA